jgi:hypothetical protein
MKEGFNRDTEIWKKYQIEMLELKSSMTQIKIKTQLKTLLKEWTSWNETTRDQRQSRGMRSIRQRHTHTHTNTQTNQPNKNKNKKLTKYK